MYTLNFANGNNQTYPSYDALVRAAKALGGEVKVIDSSAKIFAFVPKK